MVPAQCGAALASTRIHRVALTALVSASHPHWFMCNRASRPQWLVANLTVETYIGAPYNTYVQYGAGLWDVLPCPLDNNLDPTNPSSCDPATCTSAPTHTGFIFGCYRCNEVARVGYVFLYEVSSSASSLSPPCGLCLIGLSTRSHAYLPPNRHPSRPQPIRG